MSAAARTYTTTLKQPPADLAKALKAAEVGKRNLKVKAKAKARKRAR
jgi:hypothetical protein